MAVGFIKKGFQNIFCRVERTGCGIVPAGLPCAILESTKLGLAGFYWVNVSLPHLAAHIVHCVLDSY